MGKTYQTAIVGGGPVGLALGLDLGLRGVSCAIVETNTEPHRIPKGQNLTQRTLELFHFWGVADEMRAARIMPSDYPIGEIVAYRDLTSEYWYAPPGRELVRPYYFQDNERLPQYLVEAVLRRKIATLPNVDVFAGWSAVSLEQDKKGVRVAIDDARGGRSDILEADYVVGCDGSRSTIRAQMGIEREGTDFDQLMALVVFRSSELHEALKRFPPRSTYRVMHPDLNGYWRFFGRIDVGEGWFFHAPVDKGTALENFDAKSQLYKAAGFSFACELDHVGFWDLRVAVAQSYQTGRVFIAGDAAHTHPPYGAFGLNNGLEDAANLGWKLAAALKNWGGDRLLRSYGQERRPIFKETAEDFIASRIKRDGAFLDRYAPDHDRAEFERAWKDWRADVSFRVNYEPHYDGSPVIHGPPGGVSSAHGTHAYKAAAGHHLAPQMLSTQKNVFEELGGGFTLLAFDAPGGAVARFERAARALNVPLKTIRDSFCGERTAYESRLILVRPDQYVVWAGDAPPENVGALIRKVTGRE
jgi:2-polyprenyl-6-methoxyphenol hydroxylase-like FAD-dependent oxidoreductase